MDSGDLEEIWSGTPKHSVELQVIPGASSSSTSASVLGDSPDPAPDMPALGNTTNNLHNVTGNTAQSHILAQKLSSYEHLSTIDWRYELAKERHSDDQSMHSTNAFQRLFISFNKSSQIWLILVLTGVLVGLFAAFIDIVSQWLGDLRTGYCTQGFYLNKQSCCWSSGNSDDQCAEWTSWSKAMHLDDSRIFSKLVSYLIFIVVSSFLAFIASYLVTALDASYTKRSGIAEIRTILAGLVIKGFFSLKTLIIKILGLCLVVGSGLYVGKEGPLVHVACCCASLIMSQLSRIGYFSYGESKKRDLYNAASASGISVAFGAPIGGVLFVLEQMVYFANERSMWHSFVCAMVAAVTLQWVNPFRTGKLVLFQVVYDRIWHRFELGAFLFIGVLGGLYGAAVIRLNRKFVQLRSSNKWLKANPVLETAAAALITAITTYPNIYTRQQTSTLLSYLLEECPASDAGKSTGFNVVASLCNTDNWFITMVNLLLSCIVSLLFTAYSFGLAVPAGILMPSMLIGALGGRAIGLIMQTWHDQHPDFFLFSACPPEGICVTPGVYALVGAAASFTGITRLTVSSVVIMFELTGALTYVLPIMTGVIISKWVADSFGRKGIYETLIADMHFPYLERAEAAVPIPEVPVTEIMTPFQDMSVLYTKGETYGSLKKALLEISTAQFAVVQNEEMNQDQEVATRFIDPNPVLIGYISRRLLSQVISDYSASQNIQDDTPCFFDSRLDTSSLPENFLDFSTWIDMCPPVVTSQTTVLLAIDLFQSMGYASIFVTYKGRLQGVISLAVICDYVKDLETNRETGLSRLQYNNNANLDEGEIDTDSAAASLLRHQ